MSAEERMSDLRRRRAEAADAHAGLGAAVGLMKQKSRDEPFVLDQGEVTMHVEYGGGSEDHQGTYEATSDRIEFVYGGLRTTYDVVQDADGTLHLTAVGEIDPGAVVARGAEDVARHGYGGVAPGLEPLEHCDGILDQLVGRDMLVGDAVDETGVGAVFQQAAHQISHSWQNFADRNILPQAVAHFDHGLLEAPHHGVQFLRRQRTLAH